MYDFDVFLISHNHLELAINCVNALYKNTKDFYFRLTVLDDSTDETPQYFKRISKEKGNIQYLNPGRPFTNIDEMFNLGLTKTDCPFIVSLNNSCRVEPEWIGSSLNIMGKDERVAAVGIKIVKPNGMIESAGVMLYGGEVRSIGLDEPSHRCSFVYEADAVGANCCLFRREAVKDGFDFSYYLPFGGYEDVDYCLQLKDKGWKIIYCGYGAVYHDGAATRGENPDFWDKINENRKRFVARWSHLLAREMSYIKVCQ